MISRRELFVVGAGVAAAPFVKIPEAEAEATTFPQKGVELAKLRFYDLEGGYGYLDGQLSGQSIFIDKATVETWSVEPLRMGIKYAVTWEKQPRGVKAVKIYYYG